MMGGGQRGLRNAPSRPTRWSRAMSTVRWPRPSSTVFHSSLSPSRKGYALIDLERQRSIGTLSSPNGCVALAACESDGRSFCVIETYDSKLVLMDVASGSVVSSVDAKDHLSLELLLAVVAGDILAITRPYGVGGRNAVRVTNLTDSTKSFSLRDVSWPVAVVEAMGRTTLVAIATDRLILRDIGTEHEWSSPPIRDVHSLAAFAHDDHVDVVVVVEDGFRRWHDGGSELVRLRRHPAISLSAQSWRSIMQA